MITTRKSKKEKTNIEEVLADIPDDYSTILESPTNEAISQDSILLKTSTQQEHFNKDLMKEVTLEMIYWEMKDMKSQIANSQKDILLKMSTENKAMKKEIEDLKKDIKTKADIIEQLRTDLDYIGCCKTDKDEFIEFERDTGELQQYIRRNNIEIAGIPDSVGQNELEKKVIEIAKAVDIDVTENDIEACHRLQSRNRQKGPKRTIVRFVNRKFAEKLLKKGKMFKDRKIVEKAKLSNIIYINNNLCSYYRYLWGKVKGLYDRNAIDSFWVFNGRINIRFADNPDEVMKVTHLNDLINCFPDHKDLFSYDK